jgi:hypothetical protein
VLLALHSNPPLTLIFYNNIGTMSRILGGNLGLTKELANDIFHL